ncbi:MAG: CRTAC1 family protein, partial [Planctomycetota bacterium]
AVRGYAEAVEINSDVGEVMAKLARSLKQMQLRGDQSAPEGLLEAVTRRAELLNRFGQEKERFYKLGNRSNKVLAMMAKTLFELGRLWEAEAWAALAFTMPDDDLGDVKKVREQIVGALRSETPWQLSLGDTIETMDWKQFRLPKLERLDVIAGTVERDAIRPSVMPKLVDEAVKRGIRAHLNNAADAAQFQGIPLYAQMESGGCALDFDLDGWQDLYVAEAGGTPGRGNSGKNHLFRNLRGTFVETTASGTRDDGFAQGVTFGDVNEDGFPDLVVLNYGVDCLFLNNGDGTFTKRNDWFEGGDREGQPATAPWSTSAAIADIDGDGISDFFCAKYTDGMDAVDVACFDENDIENPCLPTKFAAARDEFYRGNQDGRLERVTDQWHAIPSQLGRGLGVVVGNLDGRPGNDLFVANDMTTNQFWSMENASRLTDSATLRGLGVDGRFRPQACMGIATADFDTDGDIDLFVTNFEQEHNTIYEQQDAGIWADRTVQFGLMKTSFSQLGFGTQAIDFDNDSQLEIAVANGHVYQDAEPPSTYEQQMQILYRNSSKGFAAYEIPQGDDYVGKSHVGRAMWTVDVNRDGKQDLAVTHQTEPVALLVNHTPSDNGWIELSLVGLSDARDAIGATVTAEFDGESRLKPLLSGDGFYCASQRVVHFGLGESGSDQDEIDVTIRWPDDTEESFQLSANRRYRIVQGLGEAFEME